MVIANELTRLQRLNASGLVKWNAGVVSRILNNQTYMGVMAYGKSYMRFENGFFFFDKVAGGCPLRFRPRRNGLSGGLNAG